MLSLSSVLVLDLIALETEAEYIAPTVPLSIQILNNPNIKITSNLMILAGDWRHLHVSKLKWFQFFSMQNRRNSG